MADDFVYHGPSHGHAHGHRLAASLPVRLVFAVLLAQACATPARRADAPPPARPPAGPPPAATAITSPTDEESQLVGGTLSGDPEVGAWLDDLQRAVYGVWSPPAGQQSEEARAGPAKVRVQVRQDGTLHSPTLLQSSGDAAFDQSCLGAIEIVKVTPPPPGMLERLRKGFILSFDGRGA